MQALEGGIFEWAGRQYPMEGANGPATKVNPGNSEYSRLLKRSLRAP